MLLTGAKNTLLHCGLVVAVIMGFMQWVVGLLMLSALLDFCTAKPQRFHPRMSIQQPQTIESQLSGTWKPAQSPFGILSQRPQMAPLSPNLSNAPLSIQSKQEMLGPVRELTWRFPKAPEEPVEPEIRFELQQPTPADSVGIQCWEDLVQVEVRQDFFGNDQLIEPSLLSLGGCGVADVDANARVLIFQSTLRECGSELVVCLRGFYIVPLLRWPKSGFKDTRFISTAGDRG